MQEAAPLTKEHDHSHFLTRPVFEIFHVSAHPNKVNNSESKSLHDKNLCQIRGFVQVVDEVGKSFDFYNRTMTDLETVVFGGFLSLCAFPIMPPKLLKVVVKLYDVDQDIEIANGCLEIDYSKMYEYDKVHTERVQGKHGHASVCFATFQHAIIASVEKLILHNETGGCSLGANLLFGTVAALLERKFRKADGNVDDEFPPVTLFQNQRKAEKSSSEQVEFNTPMKLFRSCVVVPFNYTLRIEADFHDMTNTRIVMAIQLNAYPQSLNKESVRKQDCEMHVKVTWLDCYDHFSRQEKVKGSPVAGEEETQKLLSEALREINKKDKTNVGKESAGAITSESKSQLSSEDEKYLKLCAEVCRVLMEEDTTKLLSETQRSPSSICGRQPCSAIPILSSCVEVYSVLICVEEKGLYVYGTIEMEDSGRCPFYIFNGHERLGDDKTLSILGPLRSFNDRPFTLRVDLKDGKGRIISKGSVSWNGSDESSTSYYERHLCSAILGDIGYAAVHYSMFSYGKQVRIRMVLRQSYRCDFINVYGTITATYGNREYPTQYEQDYYKVTLFSKLKHEGVRVKFSKVLPLSKPVVSLPFENSLMLDVNLTVVGSFEENKEVGDDDDTGRIEDIREQLEINGKVNSRISIGRGGYTFSLYTDVCNVKQCGLRTFEKQCKKTQRFIANLS